MKNNLHWLQHIAGALYVIAGLFCGLIAVQPGAIMIWWALGAVFLLFALYVISAKNCSTEKQRIDYQIIPIDGEKTKVLVRGMILPSIKSLQFPRSFVAGGELFVYDSASSDPQKIGVYYRREDGANQQTTGNDGP